MDDETKQAMSQKVIQSILSRLDELITWSRMQSKTNKSWGLTFIKRQQKSYKQQVKICQQSKKEPLKSLRRWYSGTLTERSRRVKISQQAEEGLKAIDKTQLSGKYKIWFLQFGLHPRLAWLLLIYEHIYSNT